jgi:hypothetical protein
MKIAFVFNFTLVLMWFSSVNAQIKDQSIPLADFKKNIEIPFEKVYLHLDRPYYSAGDDIWIKAYLVDAMTNELSVNSNNLNIELISPTLKIIKRLILRMDNGTVNGDMHLEDSIASGNYMIRAYTNWMRNFGDEFFFKKEIVVENRRDIKSLNQPYKEESNQKVDVQFFPESGPLIENVSTQLGFKAVNSSGYGCDISGKVISSLGDTVTSFASTHLGMGSFFFLPKKGLKYFATGFAGKRIPFRVELPTASESGYSLTVSDINSNYFRVTIKTNQKTLDKFPFNKLIIFGTSHNSLCLTANAKVRTIDTPVILPKKEFPEGVAMITLMDTTGMTYCERLYYVHQKENYRISIIPDHEVYAPRQKVTLQISVTDTTDYPVSANLSVSVVDGNQITGFEKKPDIASYLLLESEIRGYIEQPFYYFGTTISGRFQALDNLLLTQGWRNFIWKSIPDTANKFKFPIEEGITVSGRLRHVLSDKPIVGYKISMVMAGEVKTFYKFSQTDSTGKYYFDGLNFTGPQNLMVYATNKKDKGEGLISLDSIFMEPAPVSLNEAQKSETTVKNIPANIDEPNLIHMSEYNEISNYRKEAEQKYNILKKYHITDTIGLNEVKIIARKSSKENTVTHVRLYDSPDFSLKVTEIMTTTHPDVIQTLQGRVAGLYITGDWINGYKFILHGQSGEPLFLIDGKEVDYATIITLPMNAIDQIEVIKDGGKLALYGFGGSFGVISVITKRGSSGPIPPVLNFISQRVYGYYQSRSFYTPKYDEKKPEYEKPDLRTTIHWEPNVVTDEDGNATISFYNSDSKTIIKVDVEGIAEPGIPLSGKTSFEVK